MTLDRPTNSTRTLIETTTALLRANWQMDKPVRLLSVTAAGLLPEEQSCEQLSLFESADALAQRERQRKLDQTVDALRQRFGDQSVIFAHSVQKNREKGKNKRSKPD